MKGQMKFGLLLLAAFLGGVVSNLIFKPTTLSADDLRLLRTYHFQLWDKSADRMTAELLTPKGNGAIMNLNGSDGRERVQLGSYAGNYSKAERGQPFIGLSDNSNRLRMLHRLAGGNEAPVIIFKDTKKRDRIVFGLALNGEEEEPFFAYFDNDGKKHMVFGSY